MVGQEMAEASVRPSSARGVLDGAFALLEAIRRTGDAGLTRLAAESGLPKATAHRLLEQLVGLGAVARTGGRYRMGPQMFRFGKEWNPIPELRHSARVPALELAGATGASVAICVLHQGQTMAVGTIPGKTEQILPIERGQVWPWTTAAGRLLTAGMPPDVPLGPLPGSWRREAAAILDRGVCIDHEEIVPGVVCIAVPLHDPANRMTAALTALTAPTRRLPQLIDVVRRVGKTVSASARPRR